MMGYRAISPRAELAVAMVVHRGRKNRLRALSWDVEDLPEQAEVGGRVALPEACELFPR